MLFFKVMLLCNAYASIDKVLACYVLERIASVFNVIIQYKIEK